MTLDNLWYRATEAAQTAEQAYHELRQCHDGFLEFSRHHSVARRRFRKLVERIAENGAPYGAHTIVYRPSGEILLVRHEGVDMWVLPGGSADEGESFREAAAREVDEEAGVEVDYDGLAILTRVDITWRDHETWGVVPVFSAAAETIEPSITDPDEEISAARWFDELPEDTRDRQDLLTWRRRELQ